MFESLPETTRIAFARVLIVVLLFALIWLVRSLATWLLAKPLQRILQRSGQTSLDRTIRVVLAVPTTYLLLALGIDLSGHILDLNPSAMAFVTQVTRTLVIIAFALVIHRLIEVLVISRRRFLSVTGMAIDEALLPFIRTGIQFLVLVLALVIIVQAWGYDVSGLIAGLGLGGLAISLAAQDTLSNLFGFAAIVSDRPFVVGEAIKTKDVEGVIERVGLRSSRVRQADQAVVSVPNSMLASSAILNWSRLSKRKIEMTLGVTYRTRPDQIEDLIHRLRTMLVAQDKVDPNSVAVFFTGFGQSALNILVRCYLNIADWTEFSGEQERILLEIMRIVERLDLQIAFPTQSIYLENADGAPSDPPEIPLPATENEKRV